MGWSRSNQRIFSTSRRETFSDNLNNPTSRKEISRNVDANLGVVMDDADIYGAGLFAIMRR